MKNQQKGLAYFDGLRKNREIFFNHKDAKNKFIVKEGAIQNYEDKAKKGSRYKVEVIFQKVYKAVLKMMVKLETV